jgi:UDP-N-acetylmuramyl pentapeptide synthase
MCYAAVNALNEYGIKLTTDEFIKSVSVIKNPPHRLSFSKIQNIPYIINIIDDAYNANVEGFINAVAYLKTFSTMKTIITPGFVDSSKYLKLMYSKVISYLDGIDNIYLIYHKEIKVFEDLLKELKINYHIFKSFKEAYTQTLLIQNDHTILLENDLPDNYLRRG